uniref:Phosphatidylinositol 4-kinase type 2 n=1 Tax=Panagrellus redivivus TaxID=6233 RepID=A0A7E4VKX9_PANRE
MAEVLVVEKPEPSGAGPDSPNVAVTGAHVFDDNSNLDNSQASKKDKKKPHKSVAAKRPVPSSNETSTRTAIGSVKENQETSRRGRECDSMERSCQSSELLSERALEKKISKFVANSCRQGVSNEKDQDFNEILQQAVEAIKNKVFPQLIPAGSSGSYFVFDKNHRHIGVFKPKDEEPFAPLNPKWPKFFQRLLCFCCFGRACLIPNNGYLSETGASLVDDRLGLNIVPKTRVVKLFSPTFFFGRKCCMRQIDVHPKEGSFQVFVHGYRSAADVLTEWATKGESAALSSEETDSFVYQFQKLCVLDYVIRNTDRHLDNWLIRHVPGEELHLAAIDNGLAFPVKHPEAASRFRKFPFAWAELPWARVPLNESLRDSLLALLTPMYVHNLCDDLKALFRHDKNTNRLLTYNQIRVFRGQLYNLRDGLLANEPPAEWVKRDQILVTRRYRQRPTSTDWAKCFKKRPADYSSPACC